MLWASEIANSGIPSTAPLIVEATKFIQKGQIKEARQQLLNAIHRAMLAEDKHAEYPCQQLLTILAIREQDLQAASLHIQRLVEINEYVQGGFVPPIAVHI
jgi:hypothetical protein